MNFTNILFLIWSKKTSILVSLFWVCCFIFLFIKSIQYICINMGFNLKTLCLFFILIICVFQLYLFLFKWKYFIWSNIILFFIDSLICFIWFLFGVRHIGFICSGIVLLILCKLLHNEYCKSKQLK